MKLAIASLICIGVLMLARPASTATYIVLPDGTGDFPTIQAAINAVVDGDTIELTNGTFTGVGNRDIDYLGKAIAIQSQSGNPDSCIIDCQREGRGFYFHSDEGATSILEGIAVVNGDALSGGGIYCWYSSPTLIHCSILNNSAFFFGGGICWAGSSSSTVTHCIIANNSGGEFNEETGGGVYCGRASPSFMYCTISNNLGYGEGGGVSCNRSSAIFSNCTISDNWSVFGGGGIFCGDSSSTTFVNCVVGRNSSPGNGGGIYSLYSSPAFTNCTIIGNDGDHADGVYCSHSSMTINSTIVAFSGGEGIFFVDGAHSQIKHCDLFGNSGGNIVFGNNDSSHGPEDIGQLIATNANGDSCDLYFNIFPNPMFADTAAGDFHLLAGSPCIDAGDPLLPDDPDGTIADIGAFYFHQLDADLPIVLLPMAHELHSNWPNPFNTSTMIHYDVPMTGKVRLTIFNLLGQRVTTLLDQRQIAGTHTIQWDATNWPSGVYLCRMEAAGFVQTRKLVLVK